MPIYEYACRACGHRTDILHGINDDGPTFCPSCGVEGSMRKTFAPPAIVFKGSGWAKKDRSSGTRTRAAARDGDPSASKATDSGAASTGADADSGGRSDKTSSDGAEADPGSASTSAKPAPDQKVDKGSATTSSGSTGGSD